jgi:hypothetical protein
MAADSMKSTADNSKTKPQVENFLKQPATANKTTEKNDVAGLFGIKEPVYNSPRNSNINVKESKP